MLLHHPCAMSTKVSHQSFNYSTYSCTHQMITCEPLNLFEQYYVVLLHANAMLLLTNN